MQKRTRTTGGFSLIETIVYIALFVGLAALLIDSLIVMSKAYGESRASRDVLESSEVSLERVVREVRDASSIDGTMSRFDVANGALALKGIVNGSDRNVTFSLSGGQLFVSVNGDSAVPLSDPHVSVDSLVFRQVVAGPAQSVRVEATFRSLRSVTGKTIVVADTGFLRKAR